MKIVSAEFIKSAFNKGQWTTDGRPEIAFLGRSNVGKSSLINSLLNRRALARTSNTPGRTQSINFFAINDRFSFADLPGYGYAKVSKTMRSDWGKMAAEYLADRRELTLAIHLIDSRHAPTGLDVQLYDWLAVNDRPRIVVATKADKLSNNQLAKSLDVVKTNLPDVDVVPFSSVSGRGREAVWEAIETAVNKYRDFS